MSWEINSDRPIYIQLMEQIEGRIISGFYKPGENLPSVRDLALEATVNPNTMQRALSELERINLVTVKRNSGRFITKDVEVIKNLKKERASSEAHDFLGKMNQMGFSYEETLMLLSELINKKSRGVIK